MNSFSFFFRPEQVYHLSLQALQRRKFELVAFDEPSGTILARQKKTWINPEVNLHIHIRAVTDQQTKIEVLSKAKKKWLSASGEKAMEQRFFQTLFKCFDHLGE